ncbi:hypothetical protein ACIRL0_05345 [Streptomyces sp. NPDC102365]|uniref:hypothetical protein n=1 Tax=Streptomyces sp. NPDC102365 TaxID=3366162 RepID=UPI00380E7F74
MRSRAPRSPLTAHIRGVFEGSVVDPDEEAAGGGATTGKWGTVPAGPRSVGHWDFALGAAEFTG